MTSSLGKLGFTHYQGTPVAKCEKVVYAVYHDQITSPFPNQLQCKMLMFLTFCSVLGLCIVSTSSFSPPKYSTCISKDFGHGGTVCVCSEKDCASFSEGSPLSTREYAVYTSTKAGDRFRLRTARLNDTLNLKSTQSSVQLTVNSSVAFQKILGFGGAFTGMWNSYVDLKIFS